MLHTSKLARATSHRAWLLSAAVSALLLGTAGQAAAQAAAQEEATVDDVVVTGVRASVAKSIEIKRNSTQVVDTIVAEDIGKLPDNNVVEALQRVTGIQVGSRFQGEGSGLFIRGMPDSTTTWNGRAIFTAAGQTLALQDIPANLISRVDVYKTRAADQFESGLGGQVDVFSHRPFDFKGLEVSAALRGIYISPADKINPNVSLLLSNRWETGYGDVGALVNIAFNRTQFRDQNVTAGAMVPYFTATPPAGFAPYEKVPNQFWSPGEDRGLPWTPGSTLRVNGADAPYVLTRDAVISTDLLGDRKRPAANVALQWRPNDNAEYTLEYAYEGYRNTLTQRMLFNFVDWWGGLTPGDIAGVEFYPDTNVVKSRTVRDAFSFTSGDGTVQSTDTHIGAINAKWDLTPKFRVEADLSHVESEFDTQFIALRGTHVFDQVNVDFNESDGVPSLSFGNDADAADPTMWNADYFYDNAGRDKGTSTAFTLRSVYEADHGAFERLSFGVYRLHRNGSQSRWAQEGCVCGPALSTFDPDFVIYNDGFFDGEGNLPRRWVVPNAGYLRENADDIRRMVQAREPFRNVQLAANLAFTPDFTVEEDTLSMYVMADFNNEVLGRPLRSQFGLRHVAFDTSVEFAGNNAAPRASELLPSVTLRYDLTDDMRLRFNYGETLRRPEFGDLNPVRILTDDLSNTGYGSGTSGNPNLEPTHSKNIDFGYEWYFAPDSLFNVNLFRREIDGLVVRIRNQITDTDPRYPKTDTFVVTSPLNASDGVLQGAEIGLTWLPTNLPPMLDGFGVQGSLTVLDSSQNIPIPDATGVIVDQAESDFFGVSDFSYNLTLLYDRGPFNARLSYIWRDDWLRQNEARLFANPIGIWARSEGFVDMQLGYKINEKMSVTLDATNIFREKAQGYYAFEDVGNPQVSNFTTYRINSTVGVGLRWRM